MTNRAASPKVIYVIRAFYGVRSHVYLMGPGLTFHTVYRGEGLLDRYASSNRWLNFEAHYSSRPELMACPWHLNAADLKCETWPHFFVFIGGIVTTFILPPFHLFAAWYDTPHASATSIVICRGPLPLTRKIYRSYVGKLLLHWIYPSANHTIYILNYGWIVALIKGNNMTPKEVVDIRLPMGGKASA